MNPVVGRGSDNGVRVVRATSKDEQLAMTGWELNGILGWA